MKIRFLRVIIRNLLYSLVALLLLGSSTLPPSDFDEQVRAFTRTIEFDYVPWMLDALVLKAGQAALDAPRYLPEAEQNRMVRSCLKHTALMDQLQAEVQAIYADPRISDPRNFAASRLELLKALRSDQRTLMPLCENILQQQISAILSQQGLTLGGQPLPPVLYHSTPLPLALIVSPRDTITQKANISLLADLTPDEISDLEKTVEEKLDVSALVVQIGGVGVYPTMVSTTSDLDFLTDTIAHEWTHNFLTLRPLGLNYDTSPQLRTMNETTASIVGKEIGRALMQQYYPDLLPPPEPPAPPAPPPNQPAEPAPFNFRAEMRITRLKVDELLAANKIEEAEKYMETRRQFLYQNGYRIRRLNQAYFAFHGAYADDARSGGGAFGKDPVGPAVTALREQSASLADFLNRISWLSSFEALQRAVQR